MSNTSNDLNLSKEVAELSKALVKELKPGDDGSIAVDKKLYEKLPMPEGVTVETIKAVESWKKDVFHAAAHAVGTIGESFLSKHKKVEAVVLDKFHIGGDPARLAYHRTFATTTGFGANAQPVTKHGWLTGKLTSSVGNTSSASFGRLRTHFADQGAALFSK